MKKFPDGWNRQHGSQAGKLGERGNQDHDFTSLCDADGMLLELGCLPVTRKRVPGSHWRSGKKR